MMQTFIAIAKRATIPALCIAALIVLIRPNAIPHAPVLIALALAVLAVALAVQVRGALQNILITTTTLCVGFALIEGYFELREPDVDLSAPGMWAPDPDFGARAASPGPHEVFETIDGKLIYKAVYTLDDTLRRLTRSPADAPKARFFGDSYTFGVGLDDGEALPQAFADLTGMNVGNYGFPGYSPAQTLLALQTGRYDSDIGAASLLVLQTAPFHVDRTSCLPEWTALAPRYVTVAGKLELAGRCKSHPWQSLAVYQAVLQPLLERARHADVENYINVVDAVIRLARTKYRVPIVILNMERGDRTLDGTGFTAAELDARFRAAGAIVAPEDAREPLAALRIPADGHPNARANRLLALQVARAAADAGVALPKPLPPKETATPNESTQAGAAR